MTRVYFTPLARESLRDIARYIDQFSPSASRRTVRRITQRARQLALHPDSGRIVPEFEAREVRELIEGSYRIWYVVRQDQVEILAVIHGARDVGPRP